MTQFSKCIVWPVQTAPLPLLVSETLGGGSLQTRVRALAPAPHVTLHGGHADQTEKYPLTKDNYFLNTSILILIFILHKHSISNSYKVVFRYALGPYEHSLMLVSFPLHFIPLTLLLSKKWR